MNHTLSYNGQGVAQHHIWLDQFMLTPWSSRWVIKNVVMFDRDRKERDSDIKTLNIFWATYLNMRIMYVRLCINIVYVYVYMYAHHHTSLYLFLINKSFYSISFLIFLFYFFFYPFIFSLAFISVITLFFSNLQSILLFHYKIYKHCYNDICIYTYIYICMNNNICKQM